MAIQTVYYRQKIVGRGWRYRPLTVGRRLEAARNGPYFIRVRNGGGKYQWVKHDTEQAAAKAAKAAPVARQAQELGLKELTKLFAAMTPEEYLRYLFFVRTGCREQEVQYATWKDLDLKGLRFTGSGEGKSDVAFLPKSHEERQVRFTTELGVLLVEHKKRAVSDRLGIHKRGWQTRGSLPSQVQSHRQTCGAELWTVQSCDP